MAPKLPAKNLHQESQSGLCVTSDKGTRDTDEVTKDDEGHITLVGGCNGKADYCMRMGCCKFLRSNGISQKVRDKFAVVAPRYPGLESEMEMGVPWSHHCCATPAV
jgi:hypothetical protein